MSSVFKLTPEDMKQDPEKLFLIMDKLGEGSYGSVYKAMHQPSSTIVALKIIQIANNDLPDLLKELQMMATLNSPNIIRSYGHFLTQTHLYLPIEYCAGGSVADMIKLLGVLGEKECAVVMRDVLRGLKYLHEKRRLHRDIKCGNILINNKAVMKLADFGVSGELEDGISKRNTVIGTPYWMAPEIIQEVGYDFKADIWSCGITCIEMAEGRPPYYNIHPMRAIFLIPSKPPPTFEKPSAFSQVFNKFISRCLTKNPTDRPTAEELLQDPFILNAYPNSILLEKVEKCVELLAQGALKKLEEEEEESDEEEVNEESLKKQQEFASSTMMKNFSTEIQPVDPDQLANGFSTMVINEDANTMSSRLNVSQNNSTSTMKPANKSSAVVNDGTMKPVKNQQQSNGGNEEQPADLNLLLKDLETNMEKEILVIKSKFEKKRKPILEAIHSKKGGLNL